MSHRDHSQVLLPTRLDISPESRRHVITLVYQILACTVGLRSHVAEADLCGVPSPSQGPYLT
jgi:hypothetical protein